MSAAPFQNYPAKKGVNTIRLKSFSGDGWYNISLDKQTCDCHDFRQTRMPCKHLHALGIYSNAKPFVPKSHPTFSQALSAVVKSLRIRRVEDAVYWLVYLHGFGNEKRERYRTARRLLIGSAEDGHSLAVMERVVEHFSNLTKVETDLLYLAAEAVRICKVPNWWHPASGGPDYIYAGLVGERTLWQYPDQISPENMTKLIECGIEERNKSTAMAGLMGLMNTKMASTKQAELIFCLAKRYQHPLAERLAQVHLRAKSALSGDNNFLGQAVWMMAGGVSPVADQAEPSVLAAEVMELIDRAKERWKDPQPIPRWCCDGTHSAGDDVRFMGVLPYMYAVCRAFEHYGRVNPEDEWLPEFQCYDGLTIQNAEHAEDQDLEIDCTNEGSLR